MKITQKAISSFNNKKEPCFNESWNKANGIHSMAEHALLSTIQYHDSGICKRPISLKKVKEYLELNPNAFEKINERFKEEK
jgi:hypothetical protein